MTLLPFSISSKSAPCRLHKLAQHISSGRYLRTIGRCTLRTSLSKMALMVVSPSMV